MVVICDKLVPVSTWFQQFESHPGARDPWTCSCEHCPRDISLLQNDWRQQIISKFEILSFVLGFRESKAQVFTNLFIMRITCLLLLVALLCPSTLVQPVMGHSLTTCLKNIKGLKVELPNTASYNKDREIWEKKIDPAYPAVIVVPTSASQVSDAILCANYEGIRVVPKSGGHSYEGYSMQNMTLSVDLSEISYIDVSKSSNTVTCGAGADLGELYYNAWYKGGKGFNGGTCPPVGISGFLLGGGFGYYSRKAGMSCDNVVSLKMVDYKGNLAEASKSKNKDLFWASCGGGGGNFGLVVEWTIKMMDVPRVIQYASIKYPEGIETAADVLYYYQTWAAGTDDSLGTEFHFGPDTPKASLFFYYAGDGNLKDILENQSDLLKIGGSPVINYSNKTWINAVLSQAGWGLTDPKQLLGRNWSKFQDYRKEKSYYIYPKGWSKSLFVSLFNLWSKMYPEQGNIKFRASGGKIADVKPTATAFPHRDALGWMIFKAGWDEGDSEMEKQGYEWLEQSSKLIKQAGEPNYAYINYIDNQVENWENAYYRFNYKKLQGIKTAWDPKDMFSYPDLGISAKKPPPCEFKPCIQSS
jgi:hypothetical protein